jgi:hypothetical protein
LVIPDLGEVLHGTFIPTIEFNRDFVTMMVAVIGTMLSAYNTAGIERGSREEIAAGGSRLSGARAQPRPSWQAPSVTS